MIEQYVYKDYHGNNDNNIYKVFVIAITIYLALGDSEDNLYEVNAND